MQITVPQVGELPLLQVDGEEFQQLLGQFLEDGKKTPEAVVEETIELPTVEEEEEAVEEVLYHMMHTFLRVPPAETGTVSKQGARSEEEVRGISTLSMPDVRETVNENVVAGAEQVEENAPEQLEQLPVQQSMSSPPLSNSAPVPLKEPPEKQESALQIEPASLEQSNINKTVSEKEENKVTESVTEFKLPNEKDLGEPIPLKMITEAPDVLQKDSLPPLEFVPASSAVGGTKEVASPQATEKVVLHFQEPQVFMKQIAETMTIAIPKQSIEAPKVVQIKLTPETLGEMEIHLEWQGEQVEAKIYIQKAELKQVLDEQMPLLREQLQVDALIQTLSVEVLPSQSFLPQFAGEFVPHKQGTNQQGKGRYQPHQEREEEGEDPPSAYERLTGLSLYI